MARSRPHVPGAPINVRVESGQGGKAKENPRQSQAQASVIPAALRSGAKESKEKVDRLAMRAKAAKEAIRRKGQTWSIFRRNNAANTNPCAGPVGQEL